MTEEERDDVAPGLARDTRIMERKHEAAVDTASREPPKNASEARIIRVQGWLDNYPWKDTTTKDELVNQLMSQEIARVRMTIRMQ
jgi:hypothetical protein